MPTDMSLLELSPETARRLVALEMAREHWASVEEETGTSVEAADVVLVIAAKFDAFLAGGGQPAAEALAAARETLAAHLASATSDAEAWVKAHSPAEKPFPREPKPW